MKKKVMVTMYCAVCGKELEVDFARLPYEIGKKIDIPIVSNGVLIKYYVCSKQCQVTLLEYHRMTENNRIDERISKILSGNRPIDIDKLIEHHLKELSNIPDGNYLSIKSDTVKEMIQALYRLREKEKLTEKHEKTHKGIPCKKCGTYENVSAYDVKDENGGGFKCIPYFCPTCLTIAHQNHPNYIYTKL